MNDNLSFLLKLSEQNTSNVQRIKVTRSFMMNSHVIICIHVCNNYWFTHQATRMTNYVIMMIPFLQCTFILFNIVGLLYHILTLHHSSNCPSVSIQTWVDLVTSCIEVWSVRQHLYASGYPKRLPRPDDFFYLVHACERDHACVPVIFEL